MRTAVFFPQKIGISYLSAAVLFLSVVTLSSAQAATNCVTQKHEPPYKIGFANVYTAPTWMKETLKTMYSEVSKLKKQGIIENFKVTDAQGSAHKQLQQIQSMIDADMDAIVVDAGSSTALDRVIADACSKGIAVINFDSLVKTNKLTAKIAPSQTEWGKQAAKWLINQVGDHARIIVMNGPAGIAVSDQRQAGAKQVLRKHPDIKVVAKTHTAYNVGPGQQAMSNLLFTHQDVDGVLSLSGAISAGAVLAFNHLGRKLVPMTGENYRQFLELCKKNNMKCWATAQPNWMGAMAVYTAAQALQGKAIPQHVEIPLTIIDDKNIDSFLKRADQFPTDGYIYSKYSQERFKKILAKNKAK